jgi:hypothetical protein
VTLSERRTLIGRIYPGKCNVDITFVEMCLNMFKYVFIFVSYILDFAHKESYSCDVHLKDLANTWKNKEYCLSALIVSKATKIYFCYVQRSR